METYQYEVPKKDIAGQNLCLLCNKKVTEEEFGYEDFFVVFRGVSKKCFEGVICFECLGEGKID